MAIVAQFSFLSILLRIILPASSCETFQWLEFLLNRLRAQSTVSPAVGLLPLASEQACFGTAFLPFMMKQLYRCESVVTASFVGTEYPTR